MKYMHLYHKLCVVCGLIVLLTASASPVLALEALPATAPSLLGSTSMVLITEIQTGAAAGGDEFIELYNAGDAPVDISGWQARYLNAETANDTSSLIATVNAGVTLSSKAHYVLHTLGVRLPDGTPGQEYDATLSNKDKSIGLFVPDTATCHMYVRDALAWGANTKGEGVPLAGGDEAPKYIFRYYSANSYTDTDNNASDAGIVATAPVPENPALALGATPGGANSQTSPGMPPASGTVSALAPVRIKDCGGPAPAGNAATPPPAVAQDQPEPGRPVLSPRNTGLFAPQISELLPNPAKPQTDANDEFIELYNPNDAPFDLSDFKLEAGTTATKRYIFPEGTLLEPRSFVAFKSRDTKLTLPNTSGQVRLLDPSGNIIGQAEVYKDAKDGQVWLNADNRWQWSTEATPGALNVVKMPADKKKTDGSANKSPTATNLKTKAASATQTESGNMSAGQSDGVAKEEHFNPLHPGILALTGVIAVLYGIYEYRSDLANKLHEFRTNRAARRSLRQAAKRG